MKIQVYPQERGMYVVMVVPGRKAHKAPVLLSSPDRDVVMAELRTILEAADERAELPPFDPE